jgi:hypothetical protein
MGKIVYHGTFSDEAPHEYTETFHAGSARAAHERLDEAEEQGGIATVHGYEISDDAPMSRMVWADPYDYPDTGPNVVPEFNQKRIYPYKNSVEDKGSTSYVIPSIFVGNQVKHLGPQFQAPRGEGGKTIMNAVSTMVGGPFKK